MAEPLTEGTSLDRIWGLLLGGALCDTLGPPFEGSADVDPHRLGRPEAHRVLRWTDEPVQRRPLVEHLADTAGDEVHEDQLAATSPVPGKGSRGVATRPTWPRPTQPRPTRLGSVGGDQHRPSPTPTRDPFWRSHA